jgi:hypothetical protein
MHTVITDAALSLLAVADLAAGFVFAVRLNEKEKENERWPNI